MRQYISNLAMYEGCDIIVFQLIYKLYVPHSTIVYKVCSYKLKSMIQTLGYSMV